MKFVCYAVENDVFYTAIKVIEKCWLEKKNCFLLVNSEDEIAYFEDKLWSFSKLSFISHGSRFSVPSEDAEYCHTWIDDSMNTISNSPKYIISLGQLLELPLSNNIEKVFYIFEQNKLTSMANYFSNNNLLCTLWLQTGNAWKESAFE